MEKKTSFLEFSSQLNDKGIIILEFGRHYTKCGFAGEPAPRAILKTSRTDSNGQDIYLHSIKDPKQLETLLGEFIESIYFNCLAATPKEKKVVIVESVFCNSTFRTVLTNILFRRFNVPSILFVPDHLMALATLGCSTGLIVDLGGEEAISMAVVEGITLLDATSFASLGASTLDSLISDELIRNNPELENRLNPKIVEDIRTRTCFVAPFARGVEMTKGKLEKSKRRQQEAINDSKEQDKEISIRAMSDCYFLGDMDANSPATVKYPLDGLKQIDIGGNLREGVCEIFFEIFGHEHSLTTMIIETILAAPIDCRKSLSSNILIIGGLSNLPGLEHRLSEELMNIDKYERFKRKIPDQFKFHRPICQRNYVSWLGASMFCTPSSVDLRSTTREQWDKETEEGKKSFREWSDLVR